MGYRNQYWLLTSLCVCLVLLFSFSVNMPDYVAYKYFFDYNGDPDVIFVNGDSSSILFSYYALLLKSIGLNYDIFRLVTFVAIACVSFFFVKNRIEIGPFLCAYALIPFVFDLAQVRFFLSEALCFWALCFLLKKNRKSFLILVCTASLIHSMNCVWLLLFFVPIDFEWDFEKNKKSWALILFFSIICFVYSPFIQFLQRITSQISLFGEYQHYMELSVRYGFLLYVGYQINNVLFASFIHYKVTKLPMIPLWNKRLDSLNYFVQITGILFIMLTMINVNFSRYFRMFFLLNALSFSSLIFLQRCGGHGFNCKKDCVSNKLSNALFFVLFVGVWLVGETCVNHSYVTILNAVHSFYPSFL